MRIEYWAHVRMKNNSFYITLPRAEAYKLMKEHNFSRTANELAGKEVKVEVTL